LRDVLGFIIIIIYLRTQAVTGKYK